MGFNTTVIVMNDALHAIESDPLFGKKLVASIMAASIGRETLKKYGRQHDLDVSSGGHVNAATVIESHHADHTTLVAIGGNYGTVLHTHYGWRHHELEDQWNILEEAYEESTKAKGDSNVQTHTT